MEKPENAQARAESGTVTDKVEDIENTFSDCTINNVNVNDRLATPSLQKGDVGESGDNNAGIPIVANFEDNEDDCANDKDDDCANDDEYHSAEEQDDEDRLKVNDEQQRLLESELSQDEMLDRRKQAKDLKDEGNILFKDSEYRNSIKAYTKALQICPFAYPKDRSIMYSNRAACNMKLELYEKAIKDSTKALELNPAYLKAILRRAELYEKTDKLDEALKDYEKVLEMDGGQYQARAACLRLPDQIKERNERMKEEMMGKLKDLGNMVLKPFGLSTNNFQMEQNPDTGSYSIKFNQNGH